MVLKQCPKCNKQVPVACKSCPCGHSYARGRLTTASSDDALDIDDDTESGVANTVKRRRTERILRARALANDRLAAAESTRLQVRRRSRRVTSSSLGARSAIDEVPKRRRGRRKSRNVHLPSESPTTDRRTGRGQLQPRRTFAEVADPDEDEREEEEPEPDVSPEDSLRYTIILDEINRKISNNYPLFD